MRERVQGEDATVVVSGENATQHAEIPLTHEQGHWRIHLDLPALHSL
jgi:hypothetical protein